jgi:hypothetical protein
MRSKAAAVIDWELLAETSHSQTAMAIREKLQQQDYGEAMQGLEELIDALARADRRALESPLIRVMQHVIRWKCSQSGAPGVGSGPSAMGASKSVSSNRIPQV